MDTVTVNLSTLDDGRLLRKPDEMPKKWQHALGDRGYTCVRGVEHTGERQLRNFLAWSPGAQGAMMTRCGYRSDERTTKTLDDFDPAELVLEAVDGSVK